MRASPRRLVASLAALAGALAAAFGPAPARAAEREPAPTTILTRARAGVAAEAARVAGSRGLLLELDPGAVNGFRARGGGRMRFPLETGETVELDLAPVRVLAADATVIHTDAAGEHPIAIDLTVFRGEVVGERGSLVVLSLGPEGALGVIESLGRRHLVGPIRGASPGTRAAQRLHAVEDEAARGARPPVFECGADALAALAPDVRDAAPEGAQRPALDAQTRLQCDVAIDCDYEFFAFKQGGNVSAATAYVVTVMAVVSAIYERDINTTIVVPYLNLWTTSSDPWDGATTSAQLTQFQNYCNANRAGVTRDLAHLISGRPLGGGIASLGKLCTLSQAYAVSAVDGNHTYPSATASWDAVVLAHEIGHNFNSRHTQNCYWQSNGFAPAGALLDSGSTPEGSCFSGFVGIVPHDKGTIMSYCHLVTNVATAIRLDFHSACRTVMRAHAAACLSPAPVQPPGDLAASVTSGVVGLTWSASPAAGVIRYDVHRSVLAADPAPALVGSTAATSFGEPGRFGPWVWKVKAIRAADASPFSGELKVEVCTPADHAFDAGLYPAAVAAGDFDEDGIADLAFAGMDGAGTVSVLRGLGSGGVGNGTFAAPVAHPTGSVAAGIACADFDEDGILDLAVTVFSPPTLQILRGLGSGGVGNGTFATPVAYATGTDPVAVVPIDFGPDGITDLVVACRGSNQIQVFPGNGSDGVGNGTFGAPIAHAVGEAPAAIVPGYFDAGGILDLAVLCLGEESLHMLYGFGEFDLGNGQYVDGDSIPVGPSPTALAVGDFDEDGVTDLAVTRNGFGGEVVVLRKQGTGGPFAPGVVLPAGGSYVTAIVAGDWNGDGIADLAVASGGSEARLHVLLGNGAAGVGDGTFAASQSVDGPAGAVAMIPGDFMEDGKPDLVAAAQAGFNAGTMLAGSCASGVPVAIAVTSPNGGEVWPMHSRRTITWTRGTGIGTVHVEVSRDGGANWERIASDLAGTSYSWFVTGPTTSSARVRVLDANVPGRADGSDLAFQVGAPVAVEERPVALAIGPIVPHPARGAFRVALALPSHEGATIELLDVAGRRVESRRIEGAGAHSVTFRAGLPAGVYLMRLVQGGRVVSRRVAVLP